MVPSDSDDKGATIQDEDLPQSDAPDGDAPDDDEALQKLDLKVEIAAPGACQRHITVTVSVEDVQRYFDDKFSELVGDAVVPGFRQGRAPRKLVEARFRKEVAEQVKGSLLMDSMSQVSDDHELAAISEPDIDVDAVEIPDEGPFTFEFDLEVRPDFDMPQWKGLTIERPTAEFSKADVDERLESILRRYGELAPSSEPAASGDYVTCEMSFHFGGSQVSSVDETTVRLRPTLSFRDGVIEGFDKLLAGATADEERTGKAKISDEAANESLRSQEIDAKIKILDVKKLELPELTPDFLDELGGFDNEGDLRDAILSDLNRQLDYHRQQRARQQITGELTKAADWELPPEMLKRQAARELERSVMELRRSGFSDEEIRRHANELRQNSRVRTASMLKEHFILERIAEEEDIEADDGDYDAEIRLIAMQSNENPRRVRARLEKQGLMDVLRNQIIERKVIEAVTEQAKFTDVPFDRPANDVEAVDRAIGGKDRGDIPAAVKGGDAEKLADPQDHT